MPLSNNERKAIETRALTRARCAGVPIPAGEILGEKPDFRFNSPSGVLGVEVSELLIPATANEGIPPVKEAEDNKKVVRIAQEKYESAGAEPVKVYINLPNPRGRRRNLQAMAKSLADFVRSKASQARPVISFQSPAAPDGFDFVRIQSWRGDWGCGECAGYTTEKIQEALSRRISEKNKRLPEYRENLGEGSKVWLLLYSTGAVSRGMELVSSIDTWRFKFDFEAVYWLDWTDRWVKIQRADTFEGPSVKSG